MSEAAIPFTFKQFMEATGHLDVPLGEKQVLLTAMGKKKHFYTKEAAKEYAQGFHDNQLKWFKNAERKIIYTKDDEGGMLYEIQLF